MTSSPDRRADKEVAQVQILVKLLACIGGAFIALWSIAAASNASAVQILSYRDGVLINQGSGLAVSGAGDVITSNHLLYDADTVAVIAPNGARIVASTAATSASLDLALLNAAGLDATPATLAMSGEENKSLRVSGFWNDDEETQAPKVFGKKRPRFIASMAGALVETPGVLSDGNTSFIASVGRGSYGAPILTRCDSVIGMVRGKPSDDIDDLWSAHIPGPKLSFVSSQEIYEFLSSRSVSLLTSDVSCSSQEAAVVADTNRAAEEAKKRAEEEAQKRKEAEAAAEENRRAAEEADQSARDAQTLAEELGDKVEESGAAIEELGDQNQQLIIGLGAAGVVAVALIWFGMTQVKRRRADQATAHEELAEATARFSDCLFQGVTADGAPIALKVSGKDLRQEPDGMLIGRNPSECLLVLGDETVSRCHARLRLNDDAPEIEDLNSSGGTKVNGEALAPHMPMPLASGDVVEFGGLSTTFRIIED
ncbi:MAG: FHA domain-containing protein [Pseudomonadota bacterium]